MVVAFIGVDGIVVTVIISMYVAAANAFTDVTLQLLLPLLVVILSFAFLLQC